MLSSMVAQTKTPTQVVIVDDNSTDNSPNIIKEYTNMYPWISSIKTTTSSKHSPGSKVIQAFFKEMEKPKKNLTPFENLIEAINLLIIKKKKRFHCFKQMIE